MRSDFPEFGDTTKYPESLLDTWLNVASNLVNAVKWAELTNLGLELVTAHFTALSVADQVSVASGGIPGVVNGPTASKSVDKVSVTKDVAAVIIEGGGQWNMTSYGIRYLTLVNLLGAGPVQIGSCGGNGPNPWPGFLYGFW